MIPITHTTCSPTIRAVSVLLLLASLSFGQNLTEYTQTLPPEMQLLEGTGQLLGPFSSGGSERWQWVYDSSYFKIQRPILIKGLALRSDARLALAPFQFPSVQVVMASATADFSSLNTSNLDANLGSDALVVRNPLPFTGAGSPGTNCEPTVFHELVLGQSFFYNPALGQDLVIDIRVCTPTIPWSVPVDAVGGTLGTALGNT
ncbi:MAG TPA: hypothetical protein PKA37_18355, partial [Planctomycetota bacterium]|nr:hypothetical protein [Planctomycetota bacterium]